MNSIYKKMVKRGRRLWRQGPSCSALVVYNCLVSLIWPYGRNPLTSLIVIQRSLCKTLLERFVRSSSLKPKAGSESI
jgi:hypothetical protein